ncbi:hypothetical protein LXD69_08240 [Flavobacterium sediminilitoris]|uniref:Uncharacterized protein n=1 Tax=Flavobacterium sediminilitoris TaxID=2024526 RepID=A0ABY4HVD0_9FLAO|nr:MULTISPECIES: hypothetical protein [Flavobacterium]UOX35499.1 hypothetical protein LXD69_08240 [Flavobacterium sediminilitoris]
MKGIQKIKWSGKGKIEVSKSKPNVSLCIVGKNDVGFVVDKWFSETTEEDKKKNVTWILQDNKRKEIRRIQKSAKEEFTLNIPNALCGPYNYYLEASFSGKIDTKNNVGLHVNGYCTPKILSSKWSTSNDGADVRKQQFKYGHLVYLGLVTEGLNGEKSLVVEIYKTIQGGNGSKDDKLVTTITSVDVVDGEINLKIGNTANWFVHAKKDVEEFYIKIKNTRGNYISDGKSDIHARFLRMKKDQVTKAVEPSTNNTPLKVGETSTDFLKYDPCRFDSVTVIENKKDKIIFDSGKSKGSKKPSDYLIKTNGYSANTIIYEVVGPSSKEDFKINLANYTNKGCSTNHAKSIKVKHNNNTLKSIEGDSVTFPMQSKLEKFHPLPFDYIWPESNNPNVYPVFFNSCAYFSNLNQAALFVTVYPDIKWTLEFKWNHKQSFAYTYGREMHPYNIKTGRKKAIGAIMDAELAREFGEMDQSFELSLEAEWDKKSRKLEIGTEFGEKIAKTLNAFVKLKKIADSITNSPVNGGKVSFEVKAPVIAVSIQWFLEKIDEDINKIGTNIKLGIETKPLIEADFKIDLWQIVTEFGANAVCPGAGKVINFISKHLEGNIGIKFDVVFNGSINVSGEISGNTLVPKNTKGKIGIDGKIQVTLELKAWAKAEYGIAGFDGSAKANANTYLSAGVKAEIAKDGVVGYPELEFGGIVAKYVVIASIKFGVFKETFEDNGEYVIVKKCPVEFKKAYLLGPY